MLRRVALVLASLAAVQSLREGAKDTDLLVDHGGKETGDLDKVDIDLVNTEDMEVDGVGGFLDNQVEEVDPKWKYTPTEQTSWQIAVGLVAVILMALFQSIKFMVFGKATMQFRIRCSASWLSMVQLVVLVLPLIIKEWRDKLPPKVEKHWMVMAFWNAFSNADCYGTFVQYAFEMFLGCFLATLNMSLWNFVFPGGNACIHHKLCPEPTTFLFSKTTGTVASIVYATVCIYFVCASRLWIDTKRIYLLTMSSLFCSFLAPDGDWTDFAPFLLDWNARIDTAGAGVWCSLCVFLGFAIRGPLQYWIPMKVMTRGAISYSCLDHVEDGILKRVPEYVQAFSSMLEGTDPTQTLQTESISKVLDRAEEELKRLRVIASEARWEVIFFDGPLCHCSWCLDILDEIAKQSRYLLLLADETFDDGNDEEEQIIHDEIGPYLKKLLDVYSGTLWTLFDPGLNLDDRTARVSEGVDLARGLIECIMREIRALHLDKKISASEAREQIAFFYACGMWTFTAKAAMERYENVRLESWTVMPHFTNFFTETVKMKRQHAYAITITSAWLVAFLFSSYYCHHRATAVCTLSLMIIDKTRILDIFDRLGIRLLGLALGVVTANIPAYMLCRHYTEFRYVPNDLVSYLCVMLILWGLLMYGGMIGGKYEYTFQTWAGFGSVELLRPLLVFFQEPKPHSQDIKSSSFNSIIYASSGMMILAVALLMMVFCKGLFSKNKVAFALSQALKGAQRLVESIRAGGENSEQENAELQQALTQVEDVAGDTNQTAYLLSDSVSDEMVQLVLTQCRHAAGMAQSLKMLQGDVAVKLDEVMFRLLAEPSNLGLLADFVENSMKVVNMKAYKRPKLRERVYTAVRKESNMGCDWSEQLQDAANAQQLKELSATWCFEISAQFINNALAQIQAYMMSHEKRQQLAETRATASFSDICQSAEELIGTTKK